MSDATTAFATWLRDTKARKGLSYRAIAARAGVSLTRVHDIAKGVDGSPSLNTAEALAKALGTTLSRALTYKPDET